MRRLSGTIKRLLAASDTAALREVTGTTRLMQVEAFGTNPGALTCWAHVPEFHSRMPLVVVLHGCTQTAAGYDRGSGWSALADRFGFAVLFAEQNRANNANGCFNWFQPADVRRGGGEALSIRQMVAAMVDRHAIDPARIYVTGLSAGGAMTSVMLATYPDVFAGGAIIAGLPYGAAVSMPQAFDRMRGVGHPDDETYAAAIRAASPHRGPWPSVSVWHGTADGTVDVVNADHILAQWQRLHGLRDTPDHDEHIGGYRHRRWTSQYGTVRLEDYRIVGMGHGTPLRTEGDTACGTPMPFMLDAGVSSTWHIAQSWGLLGAERDVRQTRPPPPAPDASNDAYTLSPPPVSDIQTTIEKALRSAGLMR